MDILAAGLLKKNREIYNAYPAEIRKIREDFLLEIKKLLGLEKNPPLVVSGHQVEFFHPGIVSKEVLAAHMAASIKGYPVSIVLDHDPREINFKFPLIYSRDNETRIRKNFFTLAPENSFHANPDIKTVKSFQDLLAQIAVNLKGYYSNEILGNVKANLDILSGSFNPSVPLIDSMISARMESLMNLNLQVLPVKISTLVNTASWKNYCNHIIENLERFRKAYNDALHYYRKVHHIKNHAQPVPDLPENELPFWLQDKNKNRYKAKRKDSGSVLYPRAITLSIFLRLFASDIFIHGTGGGRYDLVTNRIVWNFFGVLPSDFIVKTKTMHLPLEHNQTFRQYMGQKPMHDWHTDLRNFRYHPEKILGSEHPLIVERFNLVREFKNSANPKIKIHKLLEENRLKILSGLSDFEKKLHQEKDILQKYSPDKSCLMDRSFPYFFYNMADILIDTSFKTVSCELDIS